MVTKGDKGGGGFKNQDFYGDILFEWPPTRSIYVLRMEKVHSVMVRSFNFVLNDSSVFDFFKISKVFVQRKKSF